MIQKFLLLVTFLVLASSSHSLMDEGLEDLLIKQQVEQSFYKFLRSNDDLVNCVEMKSLDYVSALIKRSFTSDANYTQLDYSGNGFPATQVNGWPELIAGFYAVGQGLQYQRHTTDSIHIQFLNDDKSRVLISSIFVVWADLFNPATNVTTGIFVINDDQFYYVRNDGADYDVTGYQPYNGGEPWLIYKFFATFETYVFESTPWRNPTTAKSICFPWNQVDYSV